MLMLLVKGQGKWLGCSLRSLFLHPSSWPRCHLPVLLNPSPYLHSAAFPHHLLTALLAPSERVPSTADRLQQSHHGYIPGAEHQPALVPPLHPLISHLHPLLPAAPTTAGPQLQRPVSFPLPISLLYLKPGKIAVVLQSVRGLLLTKEPLA